MYVQLFFHINLSIILIPPTGNNNLPNPQVWDNRKKTIYSTKLDENIINFICSKVELLLLDRELLLKMSLNSLRLANTPPFDESTIISEWNKILEEI